MVPGLAAENGVINADLPILTYQGRSGRDRIKQWLAYRISEPGIKNVEIARRLGIAPGTLNGLIYKARKEGWLTFSDPVSRIDYEIIPKVLDNLSEFLDQKDRTVTIETAKGTIFRQYQEEKGVNEVPQTILALKIETAEPDKVKVVTGHIVGTPKVLMEGEEVEKKDAVG